MQWLQNPKQSNAIISTVLDVKLLDIYRTKGRNIYKLKLTELQNNNKIKNIRDFYRSVSDFKKGNHPRTNTVNDEKGLCLHAHAYTAVGYVEEPFLPTVECEWS
jgi:hypothetical protein